MTGGEKPRLIISRAAKMDIKAAARWYHARCARLSEEFLQAVDNTAERLLHFPESGPLIYRTLRVVLLDKFLIRFSTFTIPAACG